LKRHEACGAGFDNGPVAALSYGCEVQWGDYLCRGEKEREWTAYTFQASDDNKIQMSERPGKGSGTLCQAPE
jgi:hypothetical protein